MAVSGFHRKKEKMKFINKFLYMNLRMKFEGSDAEQGTDKERWLVVKSIVTSTCTAKKLCIYEFPKKI